MTSPAPDAGQAPANSGGQALASPPPALRVLGALGQAAPSAPTAQARALATQKLAEGDKLLAEKKFREASFAYQAACEADDTSFEAHFKLGNALALLGHFPQAIDRWTRATKLSEDPAVRRSAEDNIARAQKKMGGGAGAIPGTGPQVELMRLEARRYYEQGVQLVIQRRYGEALAALNDCLRREPTLAVGYIARGSSLIGLRRYAEAVSDYQYALRLEPNLASPLYGLAEAYRGMNRIDDARNYYARYLASQSVDVRPDLIADVRTKLEQLR